MSYFTLYLANSRQFLVPVPGSRDLSSVVYAGLNTQLNSTQFLMSHVLSIIGYLESAYSIAAILDD